MAVRGPPLLNIRTEQTIPRECPITSASPRSRKAFSPTSRNGQSVFPSSTRSGLPSPSKRTMVKVKSPKNPSMVRQHQRLSSEDIHPEDPRFHEVTPKVHNSQMMMASIEDKYKNLRDNLIRVPTIDEPPSSDQESEGDDESAYRSPQRRPQNETARVHSMVSSALKNKTLPRPDFSVRDPFSLGMLSTRSSGILSANSWSSTSTFESERSGTSFPGKGCGIFLCE